jgi:hypothetical protein
VIAELVADEAPLLLGDHQAAVTQAAQVVGTFGWLSPVAATISETDKGPMRSASRIDRREGSAKPRRMLAICNNLGLLPQEFFPKDSGRDYTLSPYLETLKEHRKEFTVFSGVSHPDVDGGHPADNCF